MKQKITMVNYQNSQSLDSKKLNIVELVRISMILQLQYPIKRIKIKVYFDNNSINLIAFILWT